MKKIYLILSLFLVAYSSFAAGEEVWVVTNSGSSGYAKSASDLGAVNPCTTLAFLFRLKCLMVM